MYQSSIVNLKSDLLMPVDYSIADKKAMGRLLEKIKSRLKTTSAEKVARLKKLALNADVTVSEVKLDGGGEFSVHLESTGKHVFSFLNLLQREWPSLMLIRYRACKGIVDFQFHIQALSSLKLAKETKLFSLSSLRYLADVPDKTQERRSHASAGGVFNQTPINQLKLVGIVQLHGQSWALLTNGDGKLERVKRGERVGEESLLVGKVGFSSVVFQSRPRLIKEL